MRMMFLFLLLTSIPRADTGAQPSRTLIPYLGGDSWGYCDPGGRVIIAPHWGYAGLFRDGRAEVHPRHGGRGIIDTTGRYIIPPGRRWNGKAYGSIAGACYNAQGPGGKYGIIDSNNRELLPCLYENTNTGNSFTNSGCFFWDPYYNKYIAKVCRNGKYGVVDSLGNILIALEHDGIVIDRQYPFSSPHYFVVRKGNRMGLIDRLNRFIIPPVYDNIWLNAYNENQIMLFRGSATLIADTTGSIVHEVPGYSLGFPDHGYVPVRDSAGKSGIMNERHELVIPCDYLSAGIRADTIVLARWSSDSANKEQQFKYLDGRSLKPLSGWIGYAEYAKLPPKQQEDEKPRDGRFRFGSKMWVKGNAVYAYRIGNMLWAPVDWRLFSKGVIPVRGAADGDATALYAAVIDTNGDYIIPPQITPNDIGILNRADSMVLIRNAGGDSFAVADFRMRTVFPFQQYPVSAAFYKERVFYAVLQHDRPERRSWSGCLGSGSQEVHDYSYYLVLADGAPVPALLDYKLHWFTDSNGYRSGGRRFEIDRTDGFDGVFQGWFMAEDSRGRTGVIGIDGHIQVPEISFRYRQMSRIGPDVLLVDNFIEPRAGEHYERLAEILGGAAKSNPSSKLLKGLPYLVNNKNKVLLDSLTVGSASLNASFPVPVYYVSLKRPKETYSRDDIWFYMNDKGMGYFRKLPHW